jgi:hypothetical protein
MLATASQIQELYSRKHPGYAPRFIQINSEWGFKAWDHNFTYKQEEKQYVEGCSAEQLALKNWQMQGYAASYGLAPDVANDFLRFPHPTCDEYIYGFFTRICTQILDDHPAYAHLMWHFWSTPWSARYWKKYKHDHDINNVDFEYYGLPNLPSMLEDIGFEYAEDLHSQNVGWMPDGSFVCFDLDCCHLPDKPITKADKILSAYAYSMA